MEFCFIGNSHLKALNIYKKKLKKKYNTIDKVGASIKGLVNNNSKLKLGDDIIKYHKKYNKNILIFQLGQVDIEFGYYYKCVIDNIKYNINKYIDDLIHKYETFLVNNITLNKIVVLSIYPPVITDMIHNFNVSFRCINGKEGEYSDMLDNIKYEDVKNKFYNDSYKTRFNNHLLFNDKLKNMCNKNNIKYIDLCNILLNYDNNIKKEYIPNILDHHLVCCGDAMLNYIFNNI